MDFHSLSRKELQTLCKKNKIPANMTNVAMADALKVLENVEGIEDLNRAPGSENAQSPPESPEKMDSRSPDLPPTCRRTSARRRTVKDPVVSFENEHQSSLPPSRVRRGTRSVTQDLSLENPAEVNGSEIAGTPMMRNCRKPAPGTSVRRKNATQVNKKEGEENNWKPNENPVLGGYSTRRSLRLSKIKASESIQKQDGRTEVIKIGAMSEEDPEYLEEKSKEGSERSDRSDVSMETENKTHVNDEVQEEKGTDDDAVLVVAETEPAYSGDFPVVNDGVYEMLKSDSNFSPDLGPENVAAAVASVEVSGDIMDLDLESSPPKQICNSASAEYAVEDSNGEYANASPDHDLKIEDQILESKESEVDPDEDEKTCSHELNVIQDQEMRLATEEEFDHGSKIQFKVDESSLPLEIYDLGSMKEAIQEYLSGLEHEKCDADAEGKAQSLLESQMSDCIQPGGEKGGEKQLPENPELLDCEKFVQDADQLVPNLKNATDPFPGEELADIKLESEKCAAFVDDHDSVSSFGISIENEKLDKEYNHPEATYLDVAATIVSGNELKTTTHESIIQEPLSSSLLGSDLNLKNEIPLSSLEEVEGPDSDHLLNQIRVTPRKSSKKSTPVPRMFHILDYNKENVDNIARKLEVEIDMRNSKAITEKGNNTGAADSMTSLKSTSLRQLRKLFKEKSQISDKEQPQMGMTRSALQTLTENSLLVGDSKN